MVSLFNRIPLIISSRIDTGRIRRSGHSSIFGFIASRFTRYVPRLSSDGDRGRNRCCNHVAGTITCVYVTGYTVGTPICAVSSAAPADCDTFINASGDNGTATDRRRKGAISRVNGGVGVALSNRAHGT